MAASSVAALSPKGHLGLGTAGGQVPGRCPLCVCIPWEGFLEANLNLLSLPAGGKRQLGSADSRNPLVTRAWSLQMAGSGLHLTGFRYVHSIPQNVTLIHEFPLLLLSSGFLKYSYCTSCPVHRNLSIH